MPDSEEVKNYKFQWAHIYVPIFIIFVLCICVFKFDDKLLYFDVPYRINTKSKTIKNELNEFIPTIMHKAGVPGLSLAILQNKKIVAVLNYGSTQSIHGNAISNSSLFEAASLSKPLTAYATIRLLSEGKLNLDSIIVDSGKSYTIRQLLSHSAGFDNNLDKDIHSINELGQFAYSGQGYLKLGKIISKISGMPFDDYMNTKILKELGMDSSRFGSLQDNSNLVKPHISITMPQLIGAILFLTLTLIATLLFKVGLLMVKRKINRGHQQIIFIFSCLACVTLPTILFGLNNGLRYSLVILISIALVMLVIKGIKKLKFLHSNKSYHFKNFIWPFIGSLSFAVLVYTFWYRPPIPLKERKSMFSAAAGLKTTAEDYAKFLMEIMDSKHVPKSLSEQIIESQIQVNEYYDWGLGVGIQKGSEKIIWHWGVNYPGFQSLFIAWPLRGDGMVLFMNGGPMYLTPKNPRYSGLEMARDIVIKTFGGEHYDYWQQIQ